MHTETRTLAVPNLMVTQASTDSNVATPLEDLHLTKVTACRSITMQQRFSGSQSL